MATPAREARESATPVKVAVTVGEASQMLSLHVNTIYELVARGQIRAKRIGRAIRIPVNEIDAFLADPSTDKVG